MPPPRSRLQPSLTPTAAAVAAAAAIAAAAADGDGDLFTTDPKVSDGQATGMEGNGTLWDSADEATSSASAETRAKGQDDVPTASAGPGGLPRASSWRDLKVGLFAVVACAFVLGDDAVLLGDNILFVVCVE